MYERDAALLATTVNVVMLSDFRGWGIYIMHDTFTSAIRISGTVG